MAQLLYVREEMEKEVEIINELGLHARPAAEFVRTAQGFQSEVFLVVDDRRFPADSIMEVLTAGLARGTRLVIEATGPDESEAVARLATLLEQLPQKEAEWR